MAILLIVLVTLAGGGATLQQRQVGVEPEE